MFRFLFEFSIKNLNEGRIVHCEIWNEICLKFHQKLEKNKLLEFKFPDLSGEQMGPQNEGSNCFKEVLWSRKRLQY